MLRSVRIATGVLMLSALIPTLGGPTAAFGDEMTIPVPNVVIYPGDIVRDDMLSDEPFSVVQGGVVGQIVESRDKLVGRVAKRTLLPGRAILWIAVGTPRAVTNGSLVKLFFSEDGLNIVTQASALQDGAVGDLINVRNTESGLTISGVVQSDGSVRVGG
jgi:flagellar basal body P-ring formation protein FlgA